MSCFSYLHFNLTILMHHSCRSTHIFDPYLKELRVSQTYLGVWFPFIHFYFHLKYAFVIYVDEVCWFLLFIAEWEESEQRTTTAAGFAIIDEYHRHKHSQDPQMCRIAYEFYKEVNCVWFRNFYIFCLYDIILMSWLLFSVMRYKEYIVYGLSCIF